MGLCRDMVMGSSCGRLCCTDYTQGNVLTPFPRLRSAFAVNCQDGSGHLVNTRLNAVQVALQGGAVELGALGLDPDGAEGIGHRPWWLASPISPTVARVLPTWPSWLPPTPPHYHAPPSSVTPCGAPLGASGV